MNRKSLAWIEHIALAAFFLSSLILTGLLVLSWAENAQAKAELESKEMELEKAQGQLKTAESILEERSSEIERQGQEISNLSLMLENKKAEIENLQESLNESQTELEKTKNILSEAKEEIDQIKAEAEEMEESITESIQWFSDNSRLPSMLKTDRLMNRIKSGCKDSGELKLACISHLMEDEADITYKDDPETDRLYSIEEIIQRKGGDCEDFSLFYKAVINGLKTYDVELEAWGSGGGKYEIYEDKQKGIVWYYENAHGIKIGNIQDLNAYPVCYYYGSDGLNRLGHCIVMFSGAKISSPEDITTGNLMDARFVEPQDGSYMGEMGDEFRACEDGEEGCDYDTYTIAFIITDDDLYEFRDGRWNYYQGHREKVEKIIEELEQIQLSEGP